MHKINVDISMNLIHKTAFALYNLSWSLALPWLRLNHRLAEGYHQRALKDKLPDVVDLWIQAASVGESFLALEILKTLQVAQPIRILLTSNTRQAIDILNLALPELIRDQNQIQAAVRYFPFDKPSNMAAAAAAMRPRLMVLLETEIWPGLLLALKVQNCKILIVNGRMTEKSLQRYHFWPSIWPTLRPDKVLAISPADADRFGRLFGPDGIEVMSNIKFDCIAAATSCAGDKHKLKAILPAENPFIVLASVRQAEEILVKMHRMPNWQKFLRQTGIGYTLRSKVDRRISAGHVILWDTFGELMPAYGLAKSAFIGGSLAPLGGQNFLEALVSGIIPIIGPWWDNFAWVGREIIDAGLLRVAEDWKQVADLLLEDLAGPLPRKDVMDAALQFIQARRGGTEMACRRIIAALENT